MTYSTIQPPFTLKFREMSKKELRGYYVWFHDVLPNRINILREVVTETPGFQTWKADFSPDSLSLLGDWFAQQVETRERSEAETREINEHSSLLIQEELSELTNRTFSLAIDIGMYLSQVFLRNHPALRWEQPLGGKKFIDYGQPVLVGFDSLSLNPIQICVVLAYGLARKSKTGSRLREVYDIWSKKIGGTKLK